MSKIFVFLGRLSTLVYVLFSFFPINYDLLFYRLQYIQICLIKYPNILLDLHPNLQKFYQFSQFF
jgi:hypothetical protein